MTSGHAAPGAHSPAMERHYSIQEISALWNISEDTARRMFENEPGVMQVGQSRKRKAYRTFRVPESVLERVHRRCSFTG